MAKLRFEHGEATNIFTLQVLRGNIMKVGARFGKAAGDEQSLSGCEFSVWAPLLDQVAVEIVGAEGRPQHLKMTQDEKGYWHAIAPNLPAGTRYRYQLNGQEAWPDPASSYQPEGVHGPSEVIDHSQFEWQNDDWQSVSLTDYIIYELHIGTFTPEGTFEAVIARLPDLVALGITAIEIMPVAQFPGTRNWGYDGVFSFAVQNSYGGPTGLKQLVDACHSHGLAVVLDVVYNHFGPEGNYTGKFGPYTTDRYRTPWGSAINFDDAYSDGVRNYFIENALGWMRDYHVDALRLDAVHAIYDFGAKHFLQELAESVDDLFKELDSRGRTQHSYPPYLIAESDLNDPRLVRSIQQGGYQLDAQWSDDFHHALHARLTDEIIGYYSDFASLDTLAAAIKNRFTYDGKYSPFRRRQHGNSAIDVPSHRFVVCNQNHDQVGNRMMGDRFSTLISFDSLKLAAGATLLSPYIPLLFMGEEYGETAPFLYFVDHSDPELIEGVRSGRKEEFRAFHSEGTPPDPAGVEAFKASTLNWLSPNSEATAGNYQKSDRSSQIVLQKFYQKLIKVRRQCQIMIPSTPAEIMTEHTNDILYYRRIHDSGNLLCIMNFGEQTTKVELPLGTQTWHLQISSAAAQWSIESAKDEQAKNSADLPQTISAQTISALPFAPRSIALYRAEPA